MARKKTQNIKIKALFLFLAMTISVLALPIIASANTTYIGMYYEDDSFNGLGAVSISSTMAMIDRFLQDSKRVTATAASSFSINSQKFVADYSRYLEHTSTGSILRIAPIIIDASVSNTNPPSGRPIIVNEGVLYYKK